MDTLKPFDPKDVDSSLVRVVMHGGKHYAFFAYIDALGAAPELRAVRHQIKAPQLSSAELLELSVLIRQRGEHADWYLSFNTPWLVNRSEATAAKDRRTSTRHR